MIIYQMEKTGMSKSCFVISCLFLLTLFNACSVIEQKAVLNPKLFVVENDIGHGKEIGVIVVDERPENTLGYRGGWLY